MINLSPLKLDDKMAFGPRVWLPDSSSLLMMIVDKICDVLFLGMHIAEKRMCLCMRACVRMHIQRKKCLYAFHI